MKDPFKSLFWTALIVQILAYLLCGYIVISVVLPWIVGFLKANGVKGL